MVFKGSLAELPLTDILQLVAVSNKTGVLTLHNGDARGEIHIDKGSIAHATSGPLAGEQAFFELARWLAGEFDFTQDAQIASRTIETSNTNLLLEAARGRSTSGNCWRRGSAPLAWCSSSNRTPAVRFR